ncbi:DNA topoisomerase-3 [Evansella vedderi]|uniref:DNA topoisomerase n=1 Tax=Evansella vedderi TaxID=38282 RepID=A0ABT9ZV54_9BACI|nr:DNA topoisomerase III [Evansella vedderi]MDQ0255094.1 DNA topoisomerase-3 [Evansella vedderi]
MKLIIAEKPDQGAKLAAPFNSQKKTGYIEIKPCNLFPEGAYLTWAVGHLCELVPPEQYESKWKKWSMNTLPIVPDRFQHQVMKSKWKQYNIIKDLLHRRNVNEVIIASDAGREGEAIVRIILGLCKNNKPTKRLWISSLTPNAVTQGFNQLLDEKDTRNIYYEAISRSCADWLVGINASRAYTLLLQQQGFSDVFSTGRVQTPTLALIVKREEEINNFKSEPFWEVVATFQKDDSLFQGKWNKDGETRIKDKEMAGRIAEFCKGKMGEISSIEKERKSYQPPYLFNLSSLQATANKLYKYSPQETLDIAQKLYLKGIISYPRSDSSFITKEEAKMLPDIIQKISEVEAYEAFFPLPVESIENNKRFVNEKKVKDHYAIIPTEQVRDPKKLSSDESKIYDLIIKRLIAAHYENAIVDYTTVHSLVDKRATFISKGKETVQEGWRKVIFENQNQKSASNDDQELPSLQEGDELQIPKVDVKAGKTQAPKRFTEGELITLMKTAGKHVEDDELVKVLNRTEGLGTEATRAGIIGVLKDRKYIFVQKNRVFATEKGKLLIRALGKSILASPEMTAKWEQRLSAIGEGEASPAVFMEQVKKLSSKLIKDAVEESKTWVFDGIDVDSVKLAAPRRGKGFGKKTRTVSVGNCKKCDGKVVDKGTFYGCSNYRANKCDFTISKKLLGKSLPLSSIKELLEEGKTKVIKGFQKNDKTFDAALIWNESMGKMEFK